MKHYFAKDGNYGAAYGIFTCDTAEWTEEDWQAIDESSDRDRPVVASLIAKQYA